VDNNRDIPISLSYVTPCENLLAIVFLCFQAYNVARMLFDVADQLSESQSEVSLLSMVYPSDCHPDDNPVFILCRSDTCSFTWTGEEHIHQVRNEIFLA
jgi:hypothetical protein